MTRRTTCRRGGEDSTPVACFGLVEGLLTCVFFCCSTGGVVIVSGSGKIEISNTFEARLELLKDSALPAMRKALFGDNPNRKFHD